MKLIERKNCPMRRKNGDCLVMGGFCLYVNDEICHGLHNAYNKGVKAEPKHGRWKIYNVLDYASRPTGRKFGECSVCGKLTPEWRKITDYHNWQYCPNCGARMGESTVGQVKERSNSNGSEEAGEVNKGE